MEEEPQLSLDTFKDKRILSTNILSRCIQRCFGSGTDGAELETCFGKIDLHSESCGRAEGYTAKQSDRTSYNFRVNNVIRR